MSRPAAVAAGPEKDSVSPFRRPVRPSRSTMMNRRSLFTALAALALTVWVGSVAVAKDEAKDGNTHEGTVVSAGEHKLVMTGKDSKDEHSHDVGADAHVTLDGKDAKLSDLKKGDHVKVTLGADKKATKIEASRKGGRGGDK